MNQAYYENLKLYLSSIDRTKIAGLNEKQRQTVVDAVDQVKHNRIHEIFPSSGEFRRELYTKHMEFFAAGKTHHERLFMAANRVGKTVSGGMEVYCHTTGNYPDWWPGIKFDRPVRVLAAGDTSATTRDIIQKKLFGVDYMNPGTGMIPRDAIASRSLKRGTAEAYENVNVKHISGGESVVKLRSYDQGRKIFQGSEEDIIWLDEEVPIDVYEEALIRTLTTNGIVIMTFTPLNGLTQLVVSFLEESNDARKVVMAGWDDVPHISEEQKARALKSIQPYLRDARTKGIPSLGSGAIYPIPESEIICDPFPIPKHFKRVYGLDVGWNKTACVWAAIDPSTLTVYLYAEHYRGKAEPSVHATAIKQRGEWINGVIDTAARGRSQIDGNNLWDMYTDLGLKIHKADKAVDTGIEMMFELLSTGRLKVFSNLSNWLKEYRVYRRDKNGKIVKENDHILDATRYLAMSGLPLAVTQTEAIGRRYEQTYTPASTVGY